ncbi:hypothetical protein E0Z10_g7055 [Xylaria hypoxylon]|uniref:TMEM205-like domain-containing protein n=1 Tax=Xylaria hypoxylon TaxID=37992 RepID=A0A4Z0YRN7_9PEZI|nr:hypothetical protein E0Z10_g7055 [Xylaria hypoxylon]
MYISPPSAQSVTATIAMPFSMDPRSVLAPLHLLSFSTLLGTQLYQTFLVTKICYVSLPRSAFTTLQKRLFPAYFRSQSLLIILTAATIPSQGPLTLIANKAAWIPFAVAGVTAGLNWWVYGPRTRQIMIERIHQETRDGLQKQTTDDDDDDDVVETPSPEMQRIRRSFSHNHAMSIHINLFTIGAMLWWGWKLASSLNLELK